MTGNGDRQWQSRSWDRFTRMSTYGCGIALGFTNAFQWRDAATYAFSGGLILLGMGLSAAASKAFDRGASK